MLVFACVHLCVWDRNGDATPLFSLIEIWWTFHPHPPPMLSLIPQPAAFTQPFSTLVNAAILFYFSIHRHTYTNFVAPLQPRDTRWAPRFFTKEPLPSLTVPKSSLDTQTHNNTDTSWVAWSFDPSHCQYQKLWIFIINKLWLVNPYYICRKPCQHSNRWPLPSTLLFGGSLIK